MVPTHARCSQLHKALLNGYPDPAELQRLVLFELEVNIHEIGIGTNLPDTVYRLIGWSVRRGRFRELVTAAYRMNSENPLLQACYVQFQRATKRPPIQSHEFTLRLPTIEKGTLSDPLGVIVQRQEEAQAWKQLHEQYQTVSLELAVIFKVVSRRTPAIVLGALESHWQMEASNRVHECIDTRQMTGGLVKQKFVRDKNVRSWRESLRTHATTMDSLADECCKETRILRARLDEVFQTLSELQYYCSQLLFFIDSRLKSTLVLQRRDEGIS